MISNWGWWLLPVDVNEGVHKAPGKAYLLRWCVPGPGRRSKVRELNSCFQATWQDGRQRWVASQDRFHQYCKAEWSCKEELLGDSSQVLGRPPGKVSHCSSEWLQLKSPYLLPFRNEAPGDALKLNFVRSLGRILRWVSSLILIATRYCVTYLFISFY